MHEQMVETFATSESLALGCIKEPLQYLVLKLSMPIDSRAMDGRGARRPLLLSAAEPLQSSFERPPILAAQVLLQLSGEGDLDVVTHTVPLLLVTNFSREKPRGVKR